MARVTMLRLTLRGLWSRRSRLALSALAVVAGVAFASGAQVLTATLGAADAAATRTELTGVDVRVTSQQSAAIGPAAVPVPVLNGVRAVPGVARADGRVHVDGAAVVGRDGKVTTAPGAARYGSNWIGVGDLVGLKAGHGPAADDQIAVDAALATAGGLRIGDTVRVLTPLAGGSFTLVGIVEYSGHRDSLAGDSEVFFTTPVAQRLMLGAAGYSDIDIRAAPGVSAPALRDRLAGVLGGGYRVETGAQLTADAAGGGLSFLMILLLGFAGVAVLVGAFLVINTFGILIAQRTAELALLRAIGAGRRQIRRSVRIEALIVGGFSAALGLGLGVGGGALLSTVVADPGMPVAGVVVPPAAVLSAAGVGIGVTLLAALAPARRAARVAPVAVLAEVAAADRPLRRRTVVGGLLTAGGAGALLAPSASGFSPLLLLGVPAVIVGVTMLIPVLARPVIGLLGPVLGRSVPGGLGLRNAVRHPRRTANTAAALMIGLLLVGGFSVVAASANASVEQQFGHAAGADLYLSAQYGGSNPGPRTFDPAVLARAARIPGVRQVAGQYSDDATIDGQQTGVSAATDPVAFARLFGFTAAAGTLDVRPAGSAIVDRSTAGDFGVHVGSTVTVRLAHGPARTVTVVGIYQTELFSGWYLSPAVVPDFAGRRLDTGLVAVADPAAVPAVRARLTRLLADTPDILVSDRAAFTAQLSGEVDRVLTYVRVLLGLAILIAAFGIVNTLALSVLERTREIGMLRAAGLTRRQTVRMIAVEAVAIAVLGAVLGLTLGVAVGTLLVHALRYDGIPELVYPWTQFAGYAASAVAAGAVAAVVPAARTARTDVLAAIARP